MGVKRRLSKGRNRGKRGGDDAADAASAASISLILGKYYQSLVKPSTFANLLVDIQTKSSLDASADGPAGDLTILQAINGRYSPNDLEKLYAGIDVPMAIDGGSSRRRKRRRTKKTRSAKRSAKRSVKRSAKRNKARH